MSEQLTPEQARRRAGNIWAAWLLTKCPKGLIDPTTGDLHPSSLEQFREYINQHDNTLMLETLEQVTEVFGKVIEATKHKLVWFAEAPAKAKTPKPQPKPEPPLQIWDKRRVEREYHEGQEKLRQEAQKAIDKALEAAKKTEEDKMPDAVYYESGPRSGQINHSATEAARATWRAKHPEAW
jgi:hypothetical protein